jgi:hypothetical protein
VTAPTIDWNERRLCDDGGCTGLIGSDGRCHVCGRASQFWGDERRRGLRDEDEADAESEQRRLVRELPTAEGEIAERRLCPDGGCTGLIGIDGKCSVCGKTDDDAPIAAAARVEPDESADSETAERADPEDPDDRRLCPDGACTGLLGPDNRCKLCGRAEEV